jgi:GNAT superfamily N-acetyltransferase
MTDGEAAVHLLTPEVLQDALTLSSTAGWNQRLEDWQKLVAIAPGGSFAASADGRIVGTAIGIDYGSFGWIAMMLVDPVFRGRGLGRRLLESAMDAIPSDRPVRLDATPMGRPLYQSFGFRDETRLSRHVAEPSSRTVDANDESRGIQALTEGDLHAISEDDRRVFGGDRGTVLEWALKGAPLYARVARVDGPRRHYCLGRQGCRFDQIGPVVTGDEDTAQRLVTAALRGADGRAVVVDAFDSRVAFSDWLKRCGFRIERPLFRMCRPAGSRSWRSTDGEFAIFGPEFG